MLKSNARHDWNPESNTAVLEIIEPGLFRFGGRWVCGAQLEENEAMGNNQGKTWHVKGLF